MSTVLGYVALLFGAALIIRWTLPKPCPNCPGCRRAALANQSLRCVPGGMSPPMVSCPEHG